MKVVNLRWLSKKEVEKLRKKYLTNRKQYDKLSKLSKAQWFKKLKFLKRKLLNFK